MHVCVMCLSHTIYHQYVSNTVATNFMVSYKNIRNPNNLSKRISEPLEHRGVLIFL